MIARIWHGMVSVSKGDEYLDLMRRIALPDYLATRGNRTFAGKICDRDCRLRQPEAEDHRPRPRRDEG